EEPAEPRPAERAVRVGRGVTTPSRSRGPGLLVGVRLPGKMRIRYASCDGIEFGSLRSGHAVYRNLALGRKEREARATLNPGQLRQLSLLSAPGEPVQRF